jgi:anti-repressor protein
MVKVDDKPYAVASDVAKALGYKNTSDAINKHCRSIVKYDIPHPQSNNKTLQVSFVNEAGLYEIIFKSIKPENY